MIELSEKGKDGAYCLETFLLWVVDCREREREQVEPKVVRRGDLSLVRTSFEAFVIYKI